METFAVPLHLLEEREREEWELENNPEGQLISSPSDFVADFIRGDH